MNRSAQILNLALKNSGSTSTNNYNCESDVDQNLLSGGTNNENCGRGDNFSENPDVSSNAAVIESGTDLIRFKESLRPHCSKFVYPNYGDLESSTEEEPFSAEVSEYVPSNNYEGNASYHEADQNSEDESVIQPKPNYNVEPESTVVMVQQNEKQNKQRKMPKKLTPGRKRKRDTANWQCNLNKKKKNLGLEFKNQRGKQMPRRQMKPGCRCPRKCYEKLSLEMRSQIFSDFWALGNHNSQIQFVNNCVERLPKKQAVLETLKTSRRHWSYKYSFTIASDKIQVCKRMFFDTLDITDKWVNTIYKKIDKQESPCVSLDDQRGHHVNRPNKVSDVIKQSVRLHVSQIPVVESHYVRARSSKQYFDESLNFHKLYQLYEEWLLKTNYEPEAKATERQYREIFYKEFNIDFFKPKKDLCLQCDIYKRASIDEKESLQLKYTSHNASKFVVREFKTNIKSLAEGSKSVVAACYDLQKILTTPMSEVSAFYYKRKLAVYNFTIFDLGKNEGHCYVWDETVGRKGSNEISSSVYVFIEMKAKEGFKDFYFFSDSCAGQNKNRIVFAMYSYAAQKFNISITHLFFEVGHSQNEGDSMHALIERRKKNQVIYVPDQWVTIIRCAKTSGKPYTVTEMNQTQILDFKQFKDKQVNFDLDVENNKIKWGQIKHLTIENEHPKIIKVSYDFLSETIYCIDIGKTPVTQRSSSRKLIQSKVAPMVVNNDIILPAYHDYLPISKAKYKDLNSLCTSKAIPELYHQFYKLLKYDDSKNNLEPESD